MNKIYYAKKLNAERLRRVYEIAGSKVRQYLQAEIDHLAGFVQPRDKILEVGCGYGRVLSPLARIAGQGWGIDNSPESVELAGVVYPELNLSVMEVGNMGFDEHIFDIVFGVQNFISACKVSPEKLLRECLRVVRPGGRILLSGYADEFWPHRLRWFRQQAAEGLLGPIDEEATGNGVIICTDGFKATTFSPKEFRNLTMSFGLSGRVYTVDHSSVFCDIEVPEMYAVSIDSLSESVDSLWLNCHLATMAGSEPYGIVENAALAVNNGRIAWLGPRIDLPVDIANTVNEIHHLDGAWITPGLIDCHTHLIYAGNRAREFEIRLNGASYEEIAKAGGGILSTVAAVRTASEDELYRQSAPRLKAMLSEGVTTVEIKSGYGLDTDSELKMLRVARRLGEDLPLSVSPTFLGAHTLPPEYENRPDAYIDLIIKEMLPAVVDADLARAVDGFCEQIAFSTAQIERVFSAATRYGLKIKLHAEQLSDLKGALLAASYGALSVDHLEYLDNSDVKTLTGKGTVAVLLPGAFYFLHEIQKPPVGILRKAGVPMAISTDCNPGSSPCTSLLLMINMACVLFGLTPAEALAGVTINAAQALGLSDDVGSLEIGKKADLAVWDITEPTELAYHMGGNRCRTVVKEGEIVFSSQQV